MDQVLLLKLLAFVSFDVAQRGRRGSDFLNGFLTVYEKAGKKRADTLPTLMSRII
jgi:hypothetical protein